MRWLNWLRKWTTRVNSFGVISPNGGETLDGLSTVDIQWGVHPHAVNYELRYSVDRGISWLLIAAPSAANGTSYSWTVPNVNSAKCRVRVIARGTGNQWLSRDDSDADFSIAKVGAVISPNGGETFVGLSTVNIQWRSHPDAVNYELRYSVNRGASWPLIARPSAAGGTSFNWAVPNVNADQCRVRVIARGTENQWLSRDDSDADFSIAKWAP